LAHIHRALASKLKRHFLLFLKINYAKILIFKGLGWLYSVCGSYHIETENYTFDL